MFIPRNLILPSKINIEALSKNNIGFIVGARLSNLPIKLIDNILSSLNKTDKKIDISKYNDFKLTCQYLTKRANKDRSDRQKQVLKAETLCKLRYICDIK